MKVKKSSSRMHGESQQSGSVEKNTASGKKDTIHVFSFMLFSFATVILFFFKYIRLCSDKTLSLVDSIYQCMHEELA